MRRRLQVLALWMRGLKVLKVKQPSLMQNSTKETSSYRSNPVWPIQSPSLSAVSLSPSHFLLAGDVVVLVFDFTVALEHDISF